MSFTNEDVRKVALLARLELSEQEVLEVRPQLSSILSFVQKLSELDTEDVEPMTTALDVDNCWRKDEVSPGLSQEEALQNAPSKDDECFLVPPVMGSTRTS